MIKALVALALAALTAGCFSSKGAPMIYHSGSPWATASVNGKSGIFLVDTGASMAVLDSDIAQRSKVRVTGSREVIATTGGVTLQTVEIDKLNFAGASHLQRSASIQDLGGFSAPGGRRQAGLIGSDFFLEYSLIFDMVNSRVRLVEGSSPHNSGMESHSMRLNGGIPQIQVGFANAEAVWAKLDTGSGYSDEGFLYLDVSPEVAQRVLGARLKEAPLDTLEVVSLAGSSELRVYSYGPVTILGRTFEEVRLVVHDHGDGAFAKDDMILVTGTILNQFSIVELDYPRRKVWVRD